MNPRYCQRCYKAKSACICGAIVSIKNRSLLVILQHESEARHPMGTARILSLSLSRCEIVSAPDAQCLDKLLDDPNKQCYLLYPAPDAQVVNPGFIQNSLKPLAQKEKEPVFILLDATWRKAYGLLAANPKLQLLPKLTLAAGLVSRYRVRSSSVKGALSTVEAAAYLLSALEEDGQLTQRNAKKSQFQPLLDCLDTMAEYQVQMMPEAIRHRYIAR